jgi:hypothetical protein
MAVLVFAASAMFMKICPCIASRYCTARIRSRIKDVPWVVLFDTGLREFFASLRQPIPCGKTAVLLIETLDIQVEVV